MKILFCASEVFPFAKTGGLADVCGTLPLALETLGQEPVVVMPWYKGLTSTKKIVRVNDRLAKTTMGRTVPVYLIDHLDYYQRDGLYVGPNGDYVDNLARFQYLCQETLALLKTENIAVDIVHCHDWQTALIPIYLKTVLAKDPFYRLMKSILTIHNMAFQGIFPRQEFPQLGLAEKYFSPDCLEYYGQINLLKGGIVKSDVVTTVSPTYAKEIQTKELGCGLEGVLQARGDTVVGILNGLDYSVWDPAVDELVPYRYPPDIVDQKKRNKEKLQTACGLPVDANIPVFGFVGRLSYQKGIDLIVQAVKSWKNLAIQVVILGVGDGKYEGMLKKLVATYPDKVSLTTEFNEPLGHQIYAGSDFFLMPSVYEPCGLSQLISLKYNTVPVVYKTGGLADTITPCASGGNGFVFTEYTPAALGAAMKQAVAFYKNQEKFVAVVERVGTNNFSWEESAKRYVELYQKAMQ